MDIILTSVGWNHVLMCNYDVMVLSESVVGHLACFADSGNLFENTSMAFRLKKFIFSPMSEESLVQMMHVERLDFGIKA